jgi:hypothetical protein
VQLAGVRAGLRLSDYCQVPLTNGDGSRKPLSWTVLCCYDKIPDEE